jgi:hypothetical protein
MRHSPRGRIADPKPAAIARRAFFANNRKRRESPVLRLPHLHAYWV